MTAKGITLKVNGEEYTKEVGPNLTLLDFLRDILGVKSPKKGCDSGECGACTVILNGKPVTSCMVLAIECDGVVIDTIESLSKNGRLHPLQTAFIEENAIQCGFCTPAMILSAKALLDRNPSPTIPEIKEAIAGNLCRCTGYISIIKAIAKAAKTLREGDAK